MNGGFLFYKIPQGLSFLSILQSIYSVLTECCFVNNHDLDFIRLIIYCLVSNTNTSVNSVILHYYDIDPLVCSIIVLVIVRLYFSAFAYPLHIMLMYKLNTNKRHTSYKKECVERYNGLVPGIPASILNPVCDFGIFRYFHSMV